MIIDKKTKHSIFSLPLIFEDFTNRKELEDNGFINMYTYDVNSPLSSNHIFLVFLNLKEELLNKLKNHISYYNNYSITIDNIDYTVISFKRTFIISHIVNTIDKGLYLHLSYKQKMKILSFWYNYNDTNLHRYLFDFDAKTQKPLSENITLADKNKAVA